MPKFSKFSAKKPAEKTGFFLYINFLLSVIILSKEKVGRFK